MPSFLSEYDPFKLRLVDIPQGIKIPEITAYSVQWFAELERELLQTDEELVQLAKLNEFFPLNKRLSFKENLLMVKRESLRISADLLVPFEQWQNYYYNGHTHPDDFEQTTIEYAVRCLVGGLYDRDLFVHTAKRTLGLMFTAVRIDHFNGLFDLFEQVDAVYHMWRRLKLKQRFDRVRYLRRPYNRIYTTRRALRILQDSTLELNDFLEDVAIGDKVNDPSERQKTSRAAPEVIDLESDVDGEVDIVPSSPVAVPKSLQMDLVGADKMVDLGPRRTRMRRSSPV